MELLVAMVLIALVCAFGLAFGAESRPGFDEDVEDGGSKEGLWRS